MSIMYCDKHGCRWDSDELEECQSCQDEATEGESDVCYECPIHGLNDGPECPEC